jgi:uncharacterized integral membrane protein
MAESGTSRPTVTPKMVIIGILVLVIVVLAILNSDDVKVEFVLGDASMPLFVVIVGSALIGWVVGWFMGRRRPD